MPTTPEFTSRALSAPATASASIENLLSARSLGVNLSTKPRWRSAARQTITLVRLTPNNPEKVALLPQPADASASFSDAQWQKINERRIALIDKKQEQSLAAGETQELEKLQNQLYARREREAPLPIAQLKALQEELKREGLWPSP